jgi:hydrogenase nickel incorporation protein HypA/HybF
VHELGIAEEVLAIVADRSRGARVTRVVLEVGVLAAVLPDALRFCFDLAAEGTVAEGARLEIVEVPGRARCRRCAAEVALGRPIGRCGCGSAELDWLSGDELKVREMEVA